MFKFFNTNFLSVPSQIQQQEQIYKNNEMSNVRNDYTTLNNNNQLDILPNQQQNYLVRDELWSPPKSKTGISTFGQSNHNAIPFKTWGNFEY